MKKKIFSFKSILVLSFLFSNQGFAVDPPRAVNGNYFDNVDSGILAIISKMIDTNGSGGLTAFSSLQENCKQEIAKSRDGLEIEAFTKQFVTIPAGKLPDGTEVASFQADNPVTQKLWKAIMGSLPVGVQANCPDCPVTHVNWENSDGSPAEVQEFLKKLNTKTAHLGCTYDLPTDQQLHYMIRGDVTGTRSAKYSTAKDPTTGALFEVDDTNKDRFVTYNDNSNVDGTGSRTQPVGRKELNAFGIELGNLWKMTKDLYNELRPNWGRSIRGGSWCNGAASAGSDVRGRAVAGDRDGEMGFALVRTCSVQALQESPLNKCI